VICKETIMKAHDVLDDAGVKRSDGTHPQLVERIKMLRDERDLAKAVVTGMWAVMETSTARSMCPDWLQKITEAKEGK